MTRRCEVLIVGGGPGGSSCARRLVQAGIDVLVMDRKTFPRDKTCAGWVTPQVFEVLGVDPDEYAASRVCQPITGFVTGQIGESEQRTDYDHVVSYGIRRCEFDHFLLERSAAPCLFGETVHDLKREAGGWVVNDEVHADVIVGAGGHFCPVSRLLGGRDGRQLVTVGAQEIEFPLPADLSKHGNVRGDVPELYFCKDLAGYGWCFRKGDYLNVGLGRLSLPNESSPNTGSNENGHTQNNRSISTHVQTFCQFLRERGKLACELPSRFHGHAYQLYERICPKLVDEAALLIGDSAGLAYPQSGEGIRPAVESGFMAADVILEAAGEYRCEKLEPYATRIRERFGTPRNVAISDWIPAAFLRFLAAGLLTNRWFARHVVLDRWFLHADTPTLQVAPPRAVCGSA